MPHRRGNSLIDELQMLIGDPETGDPQADELLAEIFVELSVLKSYYSPSPSATSNESLEAAHENLSVLQRRLETEIMDFVGKEEICTNLTYLHEQQGQGGYRLDPTRTQEQL